MPEYIVVCRAQSGVRLGTEDPLYLHQYPTPIGRADFLFKTRRVSLAGFNKLVPMGLMVEIRGNAPSLHDALQEFSRTAQSLSAVWAFAGNSPIEDILPEIGYDVSPGIVEREYFQHFLPEAHFLIVERRRLSSEILILLLRAIHAHPEADRIRRAIGQYYQALRNWEPGQETLALAHLWMGMEALTPVTLRRLLSSDGLSRDALAARWQVDPKALEAEVRRREFMNNDADAYTKAKKASDGFEHGFLTFDEVFAHADAVRLKVAAYLRSAILNELSLDAADCASLVADRYEKPGHLLVTKYLRGLLIGPGPQLAAPGFDHPYIHWHTSFRELQSDSPDEVRFKMEETITPSIAEGIVFRPQRIEAWGGEGSAFVPDGV